VDRFYLDTEENEILGGIGCGSFGIALVISLGSISLIKNAFLTGNADILLTLRS